MGGRSSTGNRNSSSSMSISDFKIEEKKWNKRERVNLENAIDFMSSQFGDIRDLIGNIYRRSNINAHGLYDKDGAEGRGVATYFATGDYADEETIIHEFTHAVTEHIADHYKELGYSSRTDVFKAMRSEVYQKMNKEEPKWDGRRWAHRPEEFLSRNMEAFTVEDRDNVVKKSKEVLNTIKNWYKRVRK